jgi:hypothetical protein
LKLADGIGWVFDDTMLFPEDPSVVELHPSQVQTAHMEPSEEHLFHAPASSSVPVPTKPFSGSVALSTGVSYHGSKMAAAVMTAPAANAIPSDATDAEVSSVEHILPRRPDAPSSTWYQVAFCGGISVRVAPDVDSSRTGETLPCSEVFAVSERILGVDRRIYLKLSDGRGWVFDDSMLIPDDCSVVMIQPPPAHAAFGDAPYGQSLALQAASAEACLSSESQGAGDIQRRTHHWARGCRGGVKRNKWRLANGRQGVPQPPRAAGLVRNEAGMDQPMQSAQTGRR